MPVFDAFLWCSCAIAVFMLIWACVEVGSNDAANLVNAVSGARVLNRRTAVCLAGLFVVLGAMCSGMVMDTVRKGIFDVEMLTTHQMISIFIATYFVNTVVLFVCSCYGLPVSTTATLVFSLAGGSLGVAASSDIVHWGVLLKVGSAMLVSIILSGFCGFWGQKFFRFVIGPDCRDPQRLRRHGSWIGALVMSLLIWFLLFKGFQNFSHDLLGDFDRSLYFLLFFVVFYIVFSFLLRFARKAFSFYFFDMLAISGMLSMAFAFGQNDLANCASPGLAVLMIVAGDVGSHIPVPWWCLFACGFLISMGMRTKRAQKVTKAEIDTTSQKTADHLYAPRWCLYLVRNLRRSQSKENHLSTPLVAQNYDALRACVVLTVSASVIVFASSFGLPVSTTYVSFAAVVASGWGDRVFAQSSADQKLGRAIWVVTCWFLSIFIAIFCTAFVAYCIDRYELAGMLSIFVLVLMLQRYFHHQSDASGETSSPS